VSSDRPIEIHLHISPQSDPNILKVLDIVQRLQSKGIAMSLDLTALQAEVTRTTDAAQSAIILIEGLAAAFKEAQGDPAAIAALTAELDASAQSLAAAVTAGTPIVTDPVPVAAVEPTPVQAPVETTPAAEVPVETPAVPVDGAVVETPVAPVA